MAIAIDARTSGAKTGGGTSISWNHTMGSVSNGMLIVGISDAQSPVISISSVTWNTTENLSNTVNGSAARQVDGGSALGHANLWYILSPSSGTKTIVVTASGSGELTGGSESISGAAQTSTFNASSPQGNARAASVNPTTTVTTASGEWVVDHVALLITGGQAAPTATAGASQTQYYQLDNGVGTSMGFGSDEAATGASTTMDWTGLTGAANSGTGQICFSVQPAASGGTSALFLSCGDLSGIGSPGRFFKDQLQ